MYNRKVKISNSTEIKAVAFDIDGTLYMNRRLNLRCFPHIVHHKSLYRRYNNARKELRAKDYYGNLYKEQARIVSEKMGIYQEEAEKEIWSVCYKGLEKYFKRFDVEKGVRQLFIRLKEAGIKIAVLSDFPPEQKGDIWGLEQYCDVIIASEKLGALKPSSKVYEALIKELNVPAEEILYVGNSHRYDVEGSKKAGMQAAWVISPEKKFFGIKSELADLTFCRFRELEAFIFGKE